MSFRQIVGHRSALFRTLLGTIVLSASLAAVALATANREPAGPGGKGEVGFLETGPGPGAHFDRGPLPGRPPRPRITQRPDAVAVSTLARFRFAAGKRGLRYQCRLDRGRWRSCRPPVTYKRLAPGLHRFSVRALDRTGRRGPSARFRWRILEPRPFSVQPRPSGLSSLYPGAPAIALPLSIANPNPVPIFVTGLHVSATSSPPGCASGENLELTPAGVSPSAPLEVPASGSASLPAQGASAPTIRLLDLPVNQDACQNAQFPLAFSGTAVG